MLLACFEQSLHEFESVSVACLPFCLSPSVQPPHTEFHNFDTVSQLICFTKTKENFMTIHSSKEW